MARIFLERHELPDDLRRLADAGGHGSGGAAGPEWSPLVDVLETDSAIQIVVDLAGVDASSIDLRAGHGAILITGTKAPAMCLAHATFHVAERSFGRFARAVRVIGPCDLGAARAELINGELTITLPRIEERRGREFRIPIDRPGR